MSEYWDMRCLWALGNLNIKCMHHRKNYIAFHWLWKSKNLLCFVLVPARKGHATDSLIANYISPLTVLPVWLWAHVGTCLLNQSTDLSDIRRGDYNCPLEGSLQLDWIKFSVKLHSWSVLQQCILPQQVE